MKKIVSLICVLLMLLALVTACGNSGNKLYAGEWEGKVGQRTEIFALEEDGSGYLQNGGNLYEFTWKLTSDDLIEIKNPENNETMDVSIKEIDGKTVLVANNVMYYRAGEAPALEEMEPNTEDTVQPTENVEETPTTPSSEPTDVNSEPAASETTSEEFAPKDVSDESISSIRTYGDYIAMYKMIIDNYLSEYEEALKGTPLYSEESFKDMQEEYNENYEDQKELYADMEDEELIGKDSLVEFLINFRDSLKEFTDSMKDIAS